MNILISDRNILFSSYINSYAHAFVSLDMLEFRYVYTLFTSIIQAGAFSLFMRIENITQFDETFHLRYYNPVFKRKSVNGKYSTIKMYGVGSLYPQ